MHDPQYISIYIMCMSYAHPMHDRVAAANKSGALARDHKYPGAAPPQHPFDPADARAVGAAPSLETVA